MLSVLKEKQQNKRFKQIKSFLILYCLFINKSAELKSICRYEDLHFMQLVSLYYTIIKPVDSEAENKITRTHILELKVKGK